MLCQTKPILWNRCGISYISLFIYKTTSAVNGSIKIKKIRLTDKIIPIHLSTFMFSIN